MLERFFVLKYELLHCSLTELPPGADLMHDLNKYLPTSPVYTVIATQQLFLQNIASGFHHFYPVYLRVEFITQLKHAILTICRLDLRMTTFSTWMSWYMPQ
jgi:hypothetical protein